VLETCAVSDQKAPKFFVKLPTWKLQAGHMGVVREIMEFYYRKAGRRLQVGSLLGGVEVLCAVKIRGEFLYDWWWWWWGNRHHSSSPMAFGPGEDLGRLTHTSTLILRYPESCGRKYPL
jgi:hypothetical protein